MANHQSAIKRIRSNETKRLRNRYQLKSCRTAIKKLKKAKGGEDPRGALTHISSMLDKLAKRNVIHKRKSASMKSSLAKYINTVTQVSAASA